MNDKVVYRHRRLDANEVFYVGIGDLKRSRNRWSRSELWKRTANKAGGFIVEILTENLSHEDACELEIFLIELYGRRNLKKGNLVNLSDGGECNSGVIISEDHKSKISDSLKGRIKTKEHLENISKALTGHKRSEREVELNRQQAIEWHKNNIHSMAKKVVCTKTGIIWNSGADCARENNLSYGVLKRKLNGGRNNNTTYKYLKDE